MQEDNKIRKALYTINFDNYDMLHEPTVITPGWDYIVFTDNPDLKSDVFDVRVVKPHPGGGHLSARDYYINSQKYVPEYDLTIKIGGMIQCNTNLDDFMAAKCKDTDFNLMNHCRSCTYKEAEENKKFFGENGKTQIERQMANYANEGFPVDFGLFANGILIRKSNERIAEHEFLWWQEVSNPYYVTRDQLSFMYILWKHKLVTVHGFDEYWDILRNEFPIHKHGTDKKI